MDAPLATEPPATEPPPSEQPPTRAAAVPPTKAAAVPPPPGGDPPAAAPPPAGEPRPSGSATASARPQAGEAAAALASEMRDVLSRPGVSVALIASLVGAALTFGVAALLAAVFPDGSLIGSIGLDTSVFREASAQVTQLLGAGFAVNGEATIRGAPVLLVLVPIFGCALGAFLASQRMSGMSLPVRLAWGAATAVPFGLLMLIPALSAGELQLQEATGEDVGLSLKPSIAGSLLLGALWGALGGAAGAWWAARREGAGKGAPAGGRTNDAKAAVLTALKPLGAALLVSGVLVTGIWVVQTVRDEGDTRAFQPENRSLGLALVENILLAGDHAVNGLELGAGAEFSRYRPQFEPTDANRPLPIGSGEPFLSDTTDQELLDEFEISTPDDYIRAFENDPGALLASDDGYRIFEYSDVAEPYVFIPLLIVLIAIPVLFALYAGFAVVKRLGVHDPLFAVAHGAVVGPVWAVAMILLDALAGKPSTFVASQGSSVFLFFLVGGALLGAAGGLLASRAHATRPAPG